MYKERHRREKRRVVTGATKHAVQPKGEKKSEQNNTDGSCSDPPLPYAQTTADAVRRKDVKHSQPTNEYKTKHSYLTALCKKGSHHLKRPRRAPKNGVSCPPRPTFRETQFRPHPRAVEMSQASRIDYDTERMPMLWHFPRFPTCPPRYHQILDQHCLPATLPLGPGPPENEIVSVMSKRSVSLGSKPLLSALLAPQADPAATAHFAAPPLRLSF